MKFAYLFLLLLNASCNEINFQYKSVGSLSAVVTADFGSSIPFGSKSSAIVTLTNSGEGAISGISISGLSEPFSVSATTCSSSLPAKASCTYTVEFDSPGIVNASDRLNISSSSGSESVELSVTGVSRTFSVAAVYPGNSNWMDHIRNDEPAKDWFSQTNDACDGSESGFHSSCIHGGEKLQVQLGTVDSCADLTAQDTLGVFNWECKIVSGQATFFSIGLKDGKGLNDLIDFSANNFIDNSVTISKRLGGTNYSAGVTTPAKWHTNPIADLVLDASNSVDLTTSGTIYTIDTMGSATRNINSNGVHKVALVVKSGVELLDSYGGDALVRFNSAQFGWIEGSFNGGFESHEMIRLEHTKFSKVINVNTRNTLSASLFIGGSGAYGNLVYNLKSQESHDSDESIWMESDSHHNILTKMMLVGAGDYGSLLLYGNGVNNNIFSDTVIASANTEGILVENTSASDRNTFSHFTIINSADNAISVDSGSELTFNNFLLSNNAENVYITQSHNLIFSNFAVGDGGSAAFDLSSTTGHKFTNNLILGNNAPATCNGAAGSGLDNSCGPEGVSDHNLITGLSTASSFVGPLSVDDSVNSESSSSVGYSTLVDFFNFENRFRFWALAGGIFPDPAQRSHCTDPLTCQIWDISLRSNDSHVLNKSDDGQTSNDPFIPSLTCPAPVDGSNTLTDKQTSPNTFLVNAQEIMNDSLGDDDGLCESNEACIYSPNFGAYQGHGDYKQAGTCLFVNGTVQNVLMYAYPINGR